MEQSSSDSLLHALSFLARHHGVTLNLSGAVSGLPLVEGRLNPELLGRAAARSGFETRLVQRKITGLHPATYPVVLLMKDNTAMILLNRVSKKEFQVVKMDGLNNVYTVTLKELAKHYSEAAILARPIYTPETRSDFKSATVGRHWFWGTLWRFRGFYARVIVATSLINVMALASSLFVMNVYDRVVPNQATDTLWVLALGVLTAYGFEFVLKMLRTFFVDRAGHRIDLILGGELFARVIGMKFGARPGSAGALASQARSYEALREFFASATIAALVDLPFILLFAGVVYVLGGLTAAPLIAGAVLALFISMLMQFPIRAAVAKSYLAGNQRQALFVEGINALETIKTTRSEGEMQARLEESVHMSSHAEGKSRSFSQFALNSTALIQHIVSTAIVIVAYFQVVNERMSMGAMIACVILSGRAMAPLGLVSSLLVRLQQSWRSLRGLGDIMKAPMERDGRGTQYIGLSQFTPSIEVKNLDFTYEPELPPALDDVSITIKPGERVAVLGRVGSGKSTLLKLLVSLYEPNSGVIAVSGVDVRQLDPAELRRRVGYVSQDAPLLFGTLRSNLKAGCSELSDEAIWRAVQRTGLEGLIQASPRGIDHPVAEAGASLSGGQRQSIRLARALVEEPELLLLDEPTSSMDVATERKVLGELDAYLNEDPERTLIVATHKHSVISLADRVVVIKGGKIVADGPKEEVLSHQNKSARSRKPEADIGSPKPETQLRPDAQELQSQRAPGVSLPS